MQDTGKQTKFGHKILFNPKTQCEGVLHNDIFYSTATWEDRYVKHLETFSITFLHLLKEASQEPINPILKAKIDLALRNAEAGI